MHSGCAALNGLVRISIGRTVSFHIQVLRFDSSRNQAIRVQRIRFCCWGYFSCGCSCVPAVSPQLFFSQVPMRGGCFYACVCSSSTCAIGAGWGPLLRLRQFLPSYLSVTFAFICVGWRFGTALGTFSCGCQGCGFFPHVRDFRASFGELCVPGDI